MNVRVRHRLTGMALLVLGWSGPSLAGCELLNHANFQISQSALLEVSKDDPPGAVLRKSTTPGEGVELLRCNGGRTGFRGQWVHTGSDDFRSLTVGGENAGVGVRLRFTEQNGAIEHDFPHDYQRDISAGEIIRGDGDALYYELFRTADTVKFGKVDPGPIAFTDVEDGIGGWVRFRSMMIYELTLTRPACEIVAEDLNQRVELPPLSTAHFDPIDRATPWVPFHFTVRQCSDPDGLFAQWRFGVAGDAQPGHPEWFSLPQGFPENVALEIASDRHETLRPGQVTKVPALGTGDRYAFAVRLRKAGGPVGAGEFERGVRVEVEYL